MVVCMCALKLTHSTDLDHDMQRLKDAAHRQPKQERAQKPIQVRDLIIIQVLCSIRGDSLPTTQDRSQQSFTRDTDLAHRLELWARSLLVL